MPEAGLDGSLSIRYVNGDRCHGGKHHRSTRINFECSSTPVSKLKRAIPRYWMDRLVSDMLMGIDVMVENITEVPESTLSAHLLL